MVRTVLRGPLHAAKLRRPLEVLVTEATLVLWRAKVTLSVTVVVIAVAIVTSRTAIAASIIPAVLGFVSPKGGLRPVAEPSVVVPVAAVITSAARVPIATIVATSSPPSTTSSVLCHLDQLRIDGLVGLAQHRDQVTGLFHVVGGEESVGRARFLTAGRAANAVDIVLGGVRVVIIDDKFHILHICESVAVWQNDT